MQRVFILAAAALLIIPMAAAAPPTAEQRQRTDGLGGFIFGLTQSFSLDSCEGAAIQKFDHPAEANEDEAITLDAVVENTGSCTEELTVSLYADTDGDGDTYDPAEEVCVNTDASAEPGDTVGCSKNLEMPGYDFKVEAYANVGTFVADYQKDVIDVVQPDTTDPDVSISGPSSVTVGESFTVTVSADDNRGLDRIEWSGHDSGTQNCGGDATCSVDIADTDNSAGSWDITATAYDTAENRDSDSITVTIEEDTTDTTDDPGQASLQVRFVDAVFAALDNLS